ncbi:MAG: hypothetical protein HY560_10630 [Gemmatimonadetes bacterium]|nr:hypothetical protein [Gemmatimonadota bacterium]
MHRITFVVALIVAGCSGRGTPPPQQSQTGRPAADSPGVSGEPAAPAPDSPALGAATQRPSAQPLRGSWDLYPLSGVVGPRLSLVVDSAGGSTFWGHVESALSGDVELGRAQFRPFRGTLGADGVARVTIEATDKGPPRTDIVGRVSGGAWSITSFVWGGDEQVKPGRTWVARRQGG